MEHFFELDIKRKNNFYNLRETLNTEEEVKDYISKLTDNEQVVDIKRFHVIYRHMENMPKHDYHNDFDNWNVYNKKYKLKKEDLKTIKVSDYKDNLIEGNDNYMIKYHVITEHHNIKEMLIKVSCCYSVKDLKQIKQELYTLSKSPQVFDIVFYQYEILDINNFK